MATEVKFTPGPWSYAPAVPGAQRSFYISGNHDANNREVDIGTVQGGYYSCEANARLIAAAPDLYEAVQRLLRTHDDPADPDSAVAMEREIASVAFARAALSKANPSPA